MNRQSCLGISSVLLLFCLAVVFANLDDIRYKLPCKVPDAIEEADIVGTWRSEYANFLTPNGGGVVTGTTRISGVEKIAFYEDGTYTQSFHSEEYEYDSLENNWELTSNISEGPKLVMYNLKYFAHGLDLIDGPIHLGPQTRDLLRYKKLRAETGVETDKLTVEYPEDGFVFLYPRYCLWKLVLLQMRAGPGDPDALAVHNPVFTKVR